MKEIHANGFQYRPLNCCEAMQQVLSTAPPKPQLPVQNPAHNDGAVRVKDQKTDSAYS